MAVQYPEPDPIPSFPPPPPASSGATPPPIPALSTDEERTWAVLAHLSAVLNAFTGFLGLVAALVIYLVYKERSRFVAFHAMQSLVMQAVLWLGGGIIATVFGLITGALSIVLIGLCLVPLAILLGLIPLISLVYGVVGAVQVGQGVDFRYYKMGDWAESLMRNL